MKAAGVGAAGTALGVVPVSDATAQEWDGEVDVIVVGSGGAGLASAAGAIDGGARVLVLEKGPVVGGTTAKSGGGMWIPNNAFMQASGQPDDRGKFLKYCARVSFPELYNVNSPTYGLPTRNFKLLETFYDAAGPIQSKLHESGALRVRQVMSWDNKPVPDYLGQIEEQGGILGRQVEPIQFEAGKSSRSFAAGSVNSFAADRGFGADMIRFLSSYVEKKGSRILVEHRAVKIVQDYAGKVVGVHADTPEGTRTFRARKGVVFGSGGFAQNPEMRTNYLRTPIMGGCAVPTNTGDLIYMASELGVKFANMNEAWNQQVVLDEVLAFSSVPQGAFHLGGDSMIMVNRYGKRTADEKSVYPERSRSHQAYDAFRGDYPNLYQIMIFDEAARKFGGMLIPAPGTNLPGHIITAATLEELAAAVDRKFATFSDRIGNYSLDSSFLPNLRETIEAFNGYSVTGKDPEFHRGEAPSDKRFHKVPYNRGLPNPYIAPIAKTGPYYAILLAAGALDTKGGPAFNEHGQVLNIHDQPIPGFYVAGNCSGSPSGKSYLGPGSTLGLAVTFGYLAGQHAAAQA